MTKTIEAEGHIVCFFPPYLPDFNLIELSFSVLKAWFQRNYIWTCSNYRNFGEYLVWAVGHSCCDQFVREQFRHAASGLYLKEGEYKRFQEWLRDWETAEATTETEANEWTEEDLQEVEENLQKLGAREGAEEH
ncbi:MAG: hypothetical protein M1840_006700 [Geoglossum simile]|nr:MAG: hypothetical protein M1840_006700 [Geoglossum simile]